MNKSTIILVILGIPAAIFYTLNVVNHPIIASIRVDVENELTVISRFVLLAIVILFIVSIVVAKLRKTDSNNDWIPQEVIDILVKLRKNYGDGFDYDDARVVEAYKKGRETVEDIAVFTNMKEGKVQKIVDKLTDKGIDGFEYV